MFVSKFLGTIFCEPILTKHLVGRQQTFNGTPVEGIHQDFVLYLVGIDHKMTLRFNEQCKKTIP